MAELGPLSITAHNKDQADYLVRSRAQQRGIAVKGVRIEDAGPGAYFVTLTVDDEDAARGLAAALDEDTQVLHLRNHPRLQNPRE